MEIKWDLSLSVNEETIDNQHKQLIEQVNKLVEILSSPQVSMDQLREVMHFLHNYIKEHFSYEEGYMEENKFPGLEKHKKIHRKFVQFYGDFQKEFKEKVTSDNFSSIEIKELLEKVKTYLGDWLIHHIKTVDQEYAKYIKSRSK